MKDSTAGTGGSDNNEWRPREPTDKSPGEPHGEERRARSGVQVKPGGKTNVDQIRDVTLESAGARVDREVAGERRDAQDENSTEAQ